jgi:retinoblastoma-like protein 1
VDEQLYLYIEEGDALEVLGDISKPPKTGGSGGVAATPGRAGTTTPAWRGGVNARGLLGPSPSAGALRTSAYSPYHAKTPGGVAAVNGVAGGGGSVFGQPVGGGGGGGGSYSFPATASVPFTPISEAMASASWLHTIVAPTTPIGQRRSGGGAGSSGGAGASPGGSVGDGVAAAAANIEAMKRLVTRLSRFVSGDVAQKLMDVVQTLAGKTSAALREDAFLAGPCNRSLFSST